MNSGTINGIKATMTKSEVEGHFSHLVNNGEGEAPCHYLINGKEVSLDELSETLSNRSTASITRFGMSRNNTFSIKVNDVELSEENHDVLGDGTVEWISSSKGNCINLNNANIYKLEVTRVSSLNDEEIIINVNGNSSISGSGIVINNAFLTIQGNSSADTLNVFGAGCPAIKMDPDRHVNVYNCCLDVSATSANAIEAKDVYADLDVILTASAQSRAVSGDVHIGKMIEYTEGDATAKNFKLLRNFPTVKIWVAGQQLNYGHISNQCTFINERVSGKVDLKKQNNTYYLNLTDVTIDARGLQTSGWPTGDGIPAVRIEEDSVTIYVKNTHIYAGDPEGVKIESNTYHADGGYGICCNPSSKEKCVYKIESLNQDGMGEDGTLWIDSYDQNAIKAYRMLFAPTASNKQDSITLITQSRSCLDVNKLTVNGSTIHFIGKNIKSDVTPTLENSYIALPASGRFGNSSHEILTSGGLIVYEALIANKAAYPIPYSIRSADKQMGGTTIEGDEYELYGKTINVKAVPNPGYEFKHWQVKVIGQTSAPTTTEPDLQINLQAKTIAVAYFAHIGGEPEKYGVHLKNVQMTSFNCTDPFESEEASYDPTTKSIELNGVNWSLDWPAIQVAGGDGGTFNINVNAPSSLKGAGDNTLFLTDYDTFRFTGDSLYLGLYADEDDGRVINTTGDLQFENAYTRIEINGVDQTVFDGHIRKVIVMPGAVLEVMEQVQKCKMDTLIFPSDYKIYPDGATFRNGNVVDESGNRVLAWKVAPKPQTNPIIKYTINAVPNDEKMGTVTGSGQYQKGEEVELEAIANAGYEFAEWSNGSKVNPFVAEACMDITLTAIFRVKETAIEDVKAETSASVRKVLVDGTLYIIRDDEVYTIDGTRVK